MDQETKIVFTPGSMNKFCSGCILKGKDAPHKMKFEVCLSIKETSCFICSVTN